MVILDIMNPFHGISHSSKMRFVPFLKIAESHIRRKGVPNFLMAKGHQKALILLYWDSCLVSFAPWAP